MQALRYEESVFFAGPLVCLGPSRGRLRPYAVAGLGYYRWTAFDPQVLDPRSGVETPTSTRDFLGGSLAGGVRIQAGPTVSFELEGAFHTNLSAVPEVAAGETERRLQVLSVTAGVSLRW